MTREAADEIERLRDRARIAEETVANRNYLVTELQRRIKELESYRRTPNQLAQAILREEDAHLETARALDGANTTIGKWQDVLCAISDAMWGGELGWVDNLDTFKKEAVRRIKRHDRT